MFPEYAGTFEYQQSFWMADYFVFNNGILRHSKYANRFTILMPNLSGIKTILVGVNVMVAHQQVTIVCDLGSFKMKKYFLPSQRVIGLCSVDPNTRLVRY